MERCSACLILPPEVTLSMPSSPRRRRSSARPVFAVCSVPVACCFISHNSKPGWRSVFVAWDATIQRNPTEEYARFEGLVQQEAAACSGCADWPNSWNITNEEKQVSRDLAFKSFVLPVRATTKRSSFPFSLSCMGWAVGQPRSSPLSPRGSPEHTGGSAAAERKGPMTFMPFVWNGQSIMDP